MWRGALRSWMELELEAGGVCLLLHMAAACGLAAEPAACCLTSGRQGSGGLLCAGFAGTNEQPALPSSPAD